MATSSESSAMDLVNRLAHALSGTDGRDVTLDSLRSLVRLEVSEWRAETLDKSPTTAAPAARQMQPENKG